MVLLEERNTVISLSMGRILDHKQAASYIVCLCHLVTSFPYYLIILLHLVGNSNLLSELGPDISCLSSLILRIIFILLKAIGRGEEAYIPPV